MNQYFEQVKLLLELLPIVSEETCFALKGGTAINFFVQDLPRLSVDIDLTYIPIEDRKTSVENISIALSNISSKIKCINPNFKVTEKTIRDSYLNFSYIQKLMINNAENIVKIEPNFTLRGTVFPIEKRELVKKAQEKFGMSVSTQILSLYELYAGKICAALDRQHPRDLFDIKLMFDNNLFTLEVHKAFILYLISHNRPINELLNPNRQDIEKMFRSDFSGMAEEVVTIEQLIEVRELLIKEIVTRFNRKDKQFLLSFKNGNPEWDLLELPNVQNLPAIKWKLQNIKNMNKEKHKEQLKKLESILNNEK